MSDDIRLSIRRSCHLIFEIVMQRFVRWIASLLSTKQSWFRYTSVITVCYSILGTANGNLSKVFLEGNGSYWTSSFGGIWIMLLMHVCCYIGN